MDSVQRCLEVHLRQAPRVGQGVFIAESAVVVGDVTLGDYSSVWHNAVLRGDIQSIRIGHHTNIQDLVMVHLAEDFGCSVGDFVTVGHSAILHACEVGDECLIGMGATVLDGSVIGAQSLIGARALLTPGTQVPPGSLVLGAPAKVVRALRSEERAQLRSWAEKYLSNAGYCLDHQLYLHPMARANLEARRRQ